MTKIKTYIIYIPIIIGFLGSFCFGLRWESGKLEDKFPYKNQKVSTALSCSGDSDLGNCTSIKESDDTIIIQLLKVFGLDNIEGDHKFTDYAKAILNLTLTILALIALIISIYTFYMMVFSENEAGIKKAKGNLVGIFIALCVVGLARLIVSVISRRYQKYRLDQEDKLPTINAKIIESNINQ